MTLMSRENPNDTSTGVQKRENALACGGNNAHQFNYTTGHGTDTITGGNSCETLVIDGIEGSRSTYLIEDNAAYNARTGASIAADHILLCVDGILAADIVEVENILFNPGVLGGKLRISGNFSGTKLQSITFNATAENCVIETTELTSDVTVTGSSACTRENFADCAPREDAASTPASDAENGTTTNTTSNLKPTRNNGASLETETYSGRRKDYTLIANMDGTLTIQDRRAGSPDGTHTLVNIGLLIFADGPLSPHQALSGMSYETTSGKPAGEDISVNAGPGKKISLENIIPGECQAHLATA